MTAHSTEMSWPVNVSSVACRPLTSTVEALPLPPSSSRRADPLHQLRGLASSALTATSIVTGSDPPLGAP